VYRAELADRIRLGRSDRKSHAVWRAVRKRAITPVSSSRWAGAITRIVEDQYQSGMRSLAANAADLRAAIEVLESRCALRPGQVADPDTSRDPDVSISGRRRRGYRKAAERFAKTRRLAVLRQRLSTAEEALVAGRPSIVVGGKRLWRTRNHLDAPGMDELQWRERWDCGRMFLTADGESGKAFGNETVRVDEAGQLRVKVPASLVDKFGAHLVIGVSVRFSHRCEEWAERVSGRRAVRYDISYDPQRGRWYLDASWTNRPEPVVGIDQLRAGPVLGVDLNDGHLATCLVDSSGNPIGAPATIALPTAGLSASRRDGRLRTAISAMLDHAQHVSATAVVVENLNFTDARATGRETLGSGARGKRFRRAVAGIPTAKFVDAAYTSRWGNQHWVKPLQEQTSDPTAVTRHHGAAAAVGRRGLGLAIKRRPAGPRTGQRTCAGTPPARHDRQPNHDGRHGSSGPPRPHDGCGFTGQHPPAAAKTVRAATKQDEDLLIQQERSSLIRACAPPPVVRRPRRR
jgi:hypothetical protein